MSRPESQTTEERLREALRWIRARAFYHMIHHADERGDRKVLGEIKEYAIKALQECERDLKGATSRTDY